MTFTNPNAAKLAREILDDEEKEQLKEVVTAAVTELRVLVADTKCGSTLTFKKESDDGKHFFYAAVKSGSKWYTTAHAPRVLDSDDDLIEWLIGLEIYKRPQLELTTAPDTES